MLICINAVFFYLLLSKIVTSSICKLNNCSICNGFTFHPKQVELILVLNVSIDGCMSFPF